MRIGIDLQCIPEDASTSPHQSFGVGVKLTGVSHYAAMLEKYLPLQGSGHEFVFFKRRKRKVPFWDAHVRDAAMFRKAKLDVLHGPAYTFPLTLSLSRKGRGMKKVITIHDLAIYRHPEWFPGGQWFSTKVLVPSSIRRADMIIVPSQATKKDLMEIFKVRENKIAVIALGVEERFFKSDPNIPNDSPEYPEYSDHSDGFVYSDRYILFVGTLEPRKNISRIIEAYSKLPKDIIQQYDLVIAGAKGWKYEEIYLGIRNLPARLERPRSRSGGELGIRDKINILGYCPSDKLPELMAKATLFVFPSLYEGFGLPVLEAMATGVPVITSNISSLTEVAGDAALMVNPYSVQEISAAIQKVLEDPNLSNRLASAGRERARGFSWQKTARATIQVYSNLISNDNHNRV